MPLRIAIMVGFASAMIMTGLAILEAVRVEVRPLPKQDIATFADVQESLEQRVAQQEACREAQERGEPCQEPERSPFPREEIMGMIAPTAEDREGIEQTLSDLGHSTATAREGEETHREAGRPAEVDTVLQLQSMMQAKEIQRLFKYDANGDGVLDRAELEKAEGKRKGPIRSPFRSADEVLQADLNGDGLLTREELLEDAKRNALTLPSRPSR